MADDKIKEQLRDRIDHYLKLTEDHFTSRLEAKRIAQLLRKAKNDARVLDELYDKIQESKTDLSDSDDNLPMLESMGTWQMQIIQAQEMAEKAIEKCREDRDESNMLVIHQGKLLQSFIKQLQNLPPHWKPMMYDVAVERKGSYTTSEGKPFRQWMQGMVNEGLDTVGIFDRLKLSDDEQPTSYRK